MLVNEEILFKNLDDPFHTLKLVSGNSTKVNVTRFNIYVAVNIVETIICFNTVFEDFHQILKTKFSKLRKNVFYLSIFSNFWWLSLS